MAIGYGDGYPRHAPNGTPVLFPGHKGSAKLAGRVSMDMLTIDVTDLETTVREGDLAYLWGPLLPVDEVASHAKTIGYDLLTKVLPRAKRVYVSYEDGGLSGP